MDGAAFLIFALMILFYAVTVWFVYLRMIDAVASEKLETTTSQQPDYAQDASHHNLALPPIHFVTKEELPQDQEKQRQKLAKTAISASKWARRIQNLLLWILLIGVVWQVDFLGEDGAEVRFYFILSGLVYIFMNWFREKLVGDYREGGFSGEYMFLFAKMPPFVFYSVLFVALAEVLGFAYGTLAIVGIILGVRFLRAFLFALLISSRQFPLNLLILGSFGNYQYMELYIQWIRHAWNGLGPTFILYSSEYAEKADEPRFIRFVIVTAIAIVIFTTVAMVFSMQVYGPEHWFNCIVAVVLPLGIYYIAVSLLKSSLRRQVILDQHALDKRLDSSVWDLLVGQYYSNPRLHIHQDYRKEAISQLVSRANVVVMDWRGLTAANDKASHELDVLVNQYFLHGVLFLFDGTTDREYAIECLSQSWHSMSSRSPNVQHPPQAIKIYCMQEKPRAERMSLLTWLCEIVVIDGENLAKNS